MPSKKVTDLTELATGASGDKFLVVDVSDTTDGASGTSKWIDWDNLPSGGGGGGDSWSDAVDADIVPDADGTRDLGSSDNRFAETHTDSLDINGTTVTAINDEDDMSSDSASALATQQSIKAYVDTSSSTLAENPQTGTTYTTVLSDAGKMITANNASAITITIPPNSSVAYTSGTVISFIQKGAGQVTLAAGAGVTLNNANGLKTASQYSVISCWKEDTDVWIVYGDTTA